MSGPERVGPRMTVIDLNRARELRAAARSHEGEREVTEHYSGGRDAPRGMPAHLERAPELSAAEHVARGRELLEVLEALETGPTK